MSPSTTATPSSHRSTRGRSSTGGQQTFFDFHDPYYGQRPMLQRERETIAAQLESERQPVAREAAEAAGEVLGPPNQEQLGMKFPRAVGDREVAVQPRLRPGQ